MWECYLIGLVHDVVINRGTESGGGRCCSEVREGERSREDK